MSLMRPKYWSDEFFLTPLRTGHGAYPRSFDPILGSGMADLAADDAVSYCKKDVYDLVSLCADASVRQERPKTCAHVVRRATQALAGVGALHVTDLGVLVPTVLSASRGGGRGRGSGEATDEEIGRYIAANVLFTPHNEAASAALLVHAVFRCFLTKELRGLAVASLALLQEHAARPPVAARVYYNLTVLLRASPSPGFNAAVVAVVAQCLKAIHATHATVSGSSSNSSLHLPTGVHLVRKCFEVGRVAPHPDLAGGGGGEADANEAGWHRFVDTAFAASAPEARDRVKSMGSAELWRLREPLQGLLWDAASVAAFVPSQLNDAVANAGVAVFNLDLAGEPANGPNFQEEFVTDAVQGLAAKVEGRLLRVSEAVPLLDALRASSDLASSLAAALLGGLAVASRQYANAELLCCLGYDTLLLSFVKALLPSAASPCHVDPLSESVHGTLPRRECVFVLRCVVQLLEGLLSCGGGAALKAACLGLHAAGAPAIFLAVAPHAAVAEALWLLCAMDTTAFADHLVANAAAAATPFAALLTQLQHEDAALRLAAAMAADSGARRLLPACVVPSGQGE